MGKVASLEELLGIRERLRAEGARVVFTNGCFDLLHRGHVEYLAKAKELGDVLIVGLNSDDSVRRLKGKGRPIVPAEDRAAILAALGVVDYVCLFEDDTPTRLIRELVPDVLVKGGDYRIDQVVGGEIISRAGGKVIVVEEVEGRSTTDIIERILAFGGRVR